MKIAALSDIHGNDLALDAVLDDIRRTGGADEIWVLGDIVALGPHPIRVLDALNALPNVRCIRGNTDRYVSSGRDRPPPTLAAAMADPSKIAALAECAGTFAWTQGCLTAAGRLDWIAALPLEVSRALPDGTQVLGVHASPGQDDGPGLRADWPDEELGALIDGCTADIIINGHTHMPMDRSIRGKRLVNPGSVSNPLPGDLRASYAMITARGDGVDVQLRRVDYDRDAVIAALRQLRHPAAGYIIRHLSGGRLDS